MILNPYPNVRLGRPTLTNQCRKHIVKLSRRKSRDQTKSKTKIEI